MNQATAHPEYIWWNGERRPWDECTVHVTELGWSTVGAVFEGIRAYTGDDPDELYVFRLREHLERLERSMRLVRLHARLQPGRADGGDRRSAAGQRHPRGHLHPPAGLRRRNLRQALRPDRPRRGAADQHLADAVAPQDRTDADGEGQLLAAHLGRRDAAAGQEPLQLPQQPVGRAWKRGWTAMTPRSCSTTTARSRKGPGACVMLVSRRPADHAGVGSGILESITRDALIVLAREVLGLEVVEREVDRTELYLADEVFTCGTAAEITPIVSDRQVHRSATARSAR